MATIDEYLPIGIEKKIMTEFRGMRKRGEDEENVKGVVDSFIIW